MNVLLIGLGKYLSLFGLRSLSASISAKGHTTTMLFVPVDASLSLYKSEIDAITATARNHQPDIVGISLMFCDAARAIRLTRAIKSILDVPVIWGGLHPSLCLGDTPNCVDYVCAGEGEHPLSELLNALDNGHTINGIPGIAVRSNHGWLPPQPAPRIEDLDQLPLPDYRLDHHLILDGGAIRPLTRDRMMQHLPHIARIHPILTTRGCPHRCSFCANSALESLGTGPFVRRFSPEGVSAEVRDAVERFPDVLGMMIGDDLFISAPQEWLERFCDLYRTNIGLPFFCEIHPGHVRPGMMEMLTETGLTGVGMGIQSGSERIANGIFARGTTNQQILESTSMLDAEAPTVSRYFDIIVDNPFETESDTVQTLELVNSFRRNFELTIFPLLFYPGTELTRRARDEGINTRQGDLISRGESCRYSRSYLNRLLRSIPHTPQSWIRFWIARRHTRTGRASFYLFYFAYFVSIRKLSVNLTKFVRLQLALRSSRNRGIRARRIMRYARI